MSQTSLLAEARLLEQLTELMREVLEDPEMGGPGHLELPVAPAEAPSAPWAPLRGPGDDFPEYSLAAAGFCYLANFAQIEANLART